MIREHLDVSRRVVKSVLSLKGDRDWHVEKTQFIREWLSRTALRTLMWEILLVPGQFELYSELQDSLGYGTRNCVKQKTEATN